MMQPELRLRRAATGAAAFLLHLVLLLLLLASFRPQTFGLRAVREITISLPVRERQASARRRPVDELPSPTLLAPEAPPAVEPPALEENSSPAPPAAITEPQGDVRALGRYLYNCSGAYYERLSPREREHCLDNKWNGQEGPALTLGTARPSPFDAVIARRNEKAVPIEHPCPADKPTSNLGMPCYFSDGHQPLVQFQH